MSAPRGVAFCQAPCRRFAVSGGRSVASRPALPYRPRSQALQSRWYCTVSVWESRSLPEFFPDAPPRECPRRGASLFVRLPVGALLSPVGDRSPVVPPSHTDRGVKPSRADGTARFPCGRVGRCRNFFPDAPPRIIRARGVAFWCCFLSALCCLRWTIGRQSSRPPIPTAESSPPEPMVLHGFRVGELVVSGFFLLRHLHAYAPRRASA